MEALKLAEDRAERTLAMVVGQRFTGASSFDELATVSGVAMIQLTKPTVGGNGHARDAEKAAIDKDRSPRQLHVHLRPEDHASKGGGKLVGAARECEAQHRGQAKHQRPHRHARPPTGTVSDQSQHDRQQAKHHHRQPESEVSARVGLPLPRTEFSR
jgi:hypothetical protein